MAKERACRRCGCTYYRPCVNRLSGISCCWVERDLCSRCLTRPERARYLDGQKNPSQGRK